jgi:hypothetical protein
MLIEHCPSHLN